jgi:hypothetical protein
MAKKLKVGQKVKYFDTKKTVTVTKVNEETVDVLWAVDSVMNGIQVFTEENVPVVVLDVVKEDSE